MTTTRAEMVGGGLGRLAAALERHAELGGKASERLEGGYRWDEGPSIVVMPWVYRSLFQASGLDPDRYLKMNRLDPAFRIVLSDGRSLDIPSDPAGLRDAFAAIEPADGPALDKFLDKMDRFARLIAHSYCDRILENWGQVMLSPLMLSAALISPAKGYAREIDEHFRSPAIREMLYGFSAEPSWRCCQPGHPGSFWAMGLRGAGLGKHRGRCLGNRGPGPGNGPDPGVPRLAHRVRVHLAGGDHGVRRDRLVERLAPPPRADLVEGPIDPLGHGRRPRSKQPRSG